MEAIRCPYGFALYTTTLSATALSSAKLAFNVPVFSLPKGDRVVATRSSDAVGGNGGNGNGVDSDSGPESGFGGGFRMTFEFGALKDRVQVFLEEPSREPVVSQPRC
jgi:hypothetical protein